MNIEQLETRMTIIETRLAKLETSKPKAAEGGVASDSDLDGQYGDPVVKYDLKPKYWDGESFIGKKMSECSPEYLDATAKYYGACAFMARKDGDEKKAGYKDKDAGRARGWAARIRCGFKTEPAAYYPPSDVQNDESLPF